MSNRKTKKNSENFVVLSEFLKINPISLAGTLRSGFSAVVEPLSTTSVFLHLIQLTQNTVFEFTSNWERPVCWEYHFYLCYRKTEPCPKTAAEVAKQIEEEIAHRKSVRENRLENYLRWTRSGFPKGSTWSFTWLPWRPWPTKKAREPILAVLECG